jgi:hypothetical protein
MLVALGRHDSFKVPSYELDAPGLEMTASRFPAMNIEFWSCLFSTHTHTHKETALKKGFVTVLY